MKVWGPRLMWERQTCWPSYVSLADALNSSPRSSSSCLVLLLRCFWFEEFLVLFGFYSDLKQRLVSICLLFFFFLLQVSWIKMKCILHMRIWRYELNQVLIANFFHFAFSYRSEIFVIWPHFLCLDMWLVAVHSGAATAVVTICGCDIANKEKEKKKKTEGRREERAAEICFTWLRVVVEVKALFDVAVVVVAVVAVDSW